MTPAIARPEPGEYKEYYGRYIARVPGDDALPALAVTPAPLVALLADLAPERGAARYAPDKWTISEVVQHVADAERVFAYRALRFARADATPLPGFDENAWAPAAQAERRALAEVVAEFATVRAATLSLMRSFAPGAVMRGGEASGAGVTVRALAWIIAGHEIHHVGILRERYAI